MRGVVIRGFSDEIVLLKEVAMLEVLKRDLAVLGLAGLGELSLLVDSSLLPPTFSRPTLSKTLEYCFSILQFPSTTVPYLFSFYTSFVPLGYPF